MNLSSFMIGLTYVVYPFVWFLSVSTKFINSLLGIKNSEERAMSEEELKYLLTYSSQKGMIEQEETEMIKDVFRFTDRRAGELMTHRSEIVGIPKDATKEDVLKIVADNKFGRYPLYDGSIEHIVGTVAVKNILLLFDGNHPIFKLTDIVVPAVYIPENMQANKVLEAFKKQKVNFGIVISEYGSVEGVITLNDLSEAILGDISGDEEGGSEIISRSDGSFLVDGLMNIDDFMDDFKIKSYDDVKNQGFNTLSGLAMSILNKIPEEGETFTYKNLKFEIVDMDNSRVDKLLVTFDISDEYDI